jgi:hypothetical protein
MLRRLEWLGPTDWMEDPSGDPILSLWRSEMKCLGQLADVQFSSVISGEPDTANR